MAYISLTIFNLTGTDIAESRIELKFTVLVNRQQKAQD